MRWIGVLLLLLLGWVMLLTVQITDLYSRYTEIKEFDEQQKKMIIQYKEEVENMLDKQQEDTEHTLLVYEQMYEAKIKGIMEDW